jgi:hypothetical protein
MDFSHMKNAVQLYARTSRALNAFFESWTARYCERCFKVCKDAYPDDEFAGMELVEGLFPGCCQAGVAEDFRIMDRGEPLPNPFVTAIRRERKNLLEEKMVAAALDRADSKFVLRDKGSGELKNGVGCKWLSEGGCMMEVWKSPICLAFICNPIRQWLSISAGGDQWPLDADFCGTSRVLSAIGAASVGKREQYERAFAEVEELEACLARHSARLEDVSGVSQ